MKMYIYEIDTLKIVAELEGETNQECESQWEESEYTDTEIYATTYTPAFGCNDGLHY